MQADALTTALSPETYVDELYIWWERPLLVSLSRLAIKIHKHLKAQIQSTPATP